MTLGWNTTYGDNGRSSEHPGLVINFISTPLVIDKLISVNSRAMKSLPKMSLLLEDDRTPAITMKPRIIVDTHTDHLSRSNTFN